MQHEDGVKRREYVTCLTVGLRPKSACLVALVTPGEANLSRKELNV